MSNIDKHALRNLAVAAKLAPSWYAVGEFGDVVDPAKPEWKPVHEFCKTLTAARVLALLDELEAKEKQIDDLKATTAHSNAGWTEAHVQEARAEAAEKLIAELTEIIRSGRKFISEYAGLGDIGAAEFIKIIDRAAAGKGEEL
ncbi:ead/Ea22-like family protein [Enterobacter hormaechei]